MYFKILCTERQKDGHIWRSCWARLYNFSLRVGQRIFVHNFGSKNSLKFKVIPTLIKFLPSIVSFFFLRNLKYVALDIFGLRKHFYMVAESSEVFDFIMLTNNK